MRASILILTAFGMLLFALPGYVAAVAYFAVDDGKPSICHGDAVHGRLENGKRLPRRGTNYRAYHVTGYLTGRTFMHSIVRDTVRDAYATLALSDPELRFVYGEAGWLRGGRFPPHRTHANGTSVDFMVPVRDASGMVRELPTTLANRLGYDVLFDDKGQGDDGLTIDFEAMAKHLDALDKTARRNGIRVSRVIFEPPLQRHLFATATGRTLSGRMEFVRKPVWFRHDQHYHVDFAVPCAPR